MVDPEDNKAPEADVLESHATALEKSADEAVQEAKRKAAALEADFNARLDALENKTKGAKASYIKAGTKPTEETAGANSTGRGLGIGLAVASSIIGLPVGCFAIGYAIEMSTGNPNWKTWLGLGGAVVGIAHGAWLAQRFQK